MAARALKTDAELVPTTPVTDGRRIEQPDDRPPVGSWWWVTSGKSSTKPTDYDEPGRKWLACVIAVGSNYAEVEGVKFSNRIALDDFHARCKPEGDPNAYIDRKVGFHKAEVRKLMGKIQKLCHQLGVPMRQALANAEADAEPSSQALAVVHGTADVKAYGKSLIKAKDKTLPELFAKVKEQHEAMAKWMRAELIPAEAELSAAKLVTAVIGDKIHTVELYAGLTEKLTCVREGATAAVDAKVHVMQRRHYMDEECLARYEAGGMSFDDIEAFDKWIGRDENFHRLLPHDRTIVAFRIRRYDRRTDEHTLEAFISLWYENQESRQTYLYIRNGSQLWRMITSIDFDEELFPSRADSDLLGDDELWLRPGAHGLRMNDGLITGRTRAGMTRKHQGKRGHLAQKIWQWHRAGCPEGDWNYTAIDHEEEQYGWKPGEVHEQSGKPDDWDVDRGNPADEYELLTPENIYYDDAMARIRRAAFEHNRIAVIIQGLLDRSVCLHPHAPWRIWTPEGFAAGIELVYDVSRAITPGEAIDFEAYRAQLNKSIRPGCYTIGQKRAWIEYMEERHGSKWRDYIRYDNKGPAHIAQVERVKRDGSCSFRWTRSRSKAKWVQHPTKRGYLKASYPPIDTGWICPGEHLTCVDAYTPGDFHLFYDDPRTRADYVRWAPILLAAENWHHRRRLAKDDDEVPNILDEEETDV